MTGRALSGGRAASRPCSTRDRTDDLRDVGVGTFGLPTSNDRRARDRTGRSDSRDASQRRRGQHRRSLGARFGRPLHAALAPSVFGRSRNVPARVVHDEVQPKFCDAVANDPVSTRFTRARPPNSRRVGSSYWPRSKRSSAPSLEWPRRRCSPPRRRGGVDWPVVDARLSQRERRSATSYLDSRLGHGTNPASVTLGGYEVTTVPSNDRGLVDLEKLKASLGPTSPASC